MQTAISIRVWAKLDFHGYSSDMLNLAYIGAKNFEFRPITGFVFFCFKINKSSYWSKFKIFGANVGLIKHITPCQTDMYPCPNSSDVLGTYLAWPSLDSLAYLLVITIWTNIPLLIIIQLFIKSKKCTKVKFLWIIHKLILLLSASAWLFGTSMLHQYFTLKGQKCYFEDSQNCQYYFDRCDTTKSNVVV